MQKIITHTEKAKKILEEKGYANVEVIKHGIDIKKFKYNENYDGNNKLIGYVGRIVPWKGLYEILKVAKEIGTKVIMMGRIDKGDYWQKCQEFKEQMDIRFNTPDEEQTKVYHEMGIYVGNSIDGVEEGTLPFLEAMSCGIPVVTTLSGEANDIVKDGVNSIAVEFENYDSLKKGIEKAFAMSQKEKDKMRSEAWNTVREMNDVRMARNYEKVYYKTIYGKDLVSVIIPTFERSDTITKVLDGYKNQTYKPIELIVVDDYSQDQGKTYDAILYWKAENDDIPLKYINTGHSGYGLAMARNMGIFEASGYYLLFSDDRFVPAPTAVHSFVKNCSGVKEKNVVYGFKGAKDRPFVENFFIIRKKHIVSAGMFNERIDKYGGQSQEFRERLHSQGFKIQYDPNAIAEPICGTHNKSKRRYEVYDMKNKLFKLKN